MNYELRFLKLLGYTRDIVNNKEGFLEYYDIFDTKGILVGNMRIENNEFHMDINNDDVMCNTVRNINCDFLMMYFYLLIDGNMELCKLDFDNVISIVKGDISYSLGRFESTAVFSIVYHSEDCMENRLYKRYLWVDKERGFSDEIDRNEAFNCCYIEKYTRSGTNSYYAVVHNNGVRILGRSKGDYFDSLSDLSIDEVINNHADGVELYNEVCDILNKCPFKGDLNEALGFDESNNYKLVMNLKDDKD